jgi:transposase
MHSLHSHFASSPLHFMPKYHINTADPTNRELIVDFYERHGEASTKAEFGVTRFSINRWRTLQRDTGSFAPHYERSGRLPALSPADVGRLERALIKDPFLTNRDLAAVVYNKITPRAAGFYVKNSRNCFVQKLEQLDVEESFSERHAEEGAAFQKKVSRVPLYKRVYVDETWIGAGVRRRTGRFPSGAPAWAPRNRKYPRKTVIGAVRHGGWIQPSRIYNKGSITTAEFEEWVKHDLAPNLQEGDVVLWDRLGKSGRALNPTALHFSPTAAAAITARGASLLFLPSYGKHFNPIEVIFGEAKRNYDKKVSRLARFAKPSSLTFQQLSRAWHSAEREVSAAAFSHAFTERANGREFFRVCQEKGLI